MKILKVGKSLWCKNWFCYFLLLFRNLSEGQEIVYTIKSARNTNLESQTWKIFVFSLWVSLIKLCILILFSFFHFRVTWPGNRVRGNLPIDFEIMILNFERLYGLSYIKRKHVICRFQKHALPWISKLVVKITVTFRYEWSKWPFYTKMIWSGHVTHQSKAYELNIPKKSFSL